MRTKTLGQIAHETGERAGSWVRKWEHMHHSQRTEWEVLADAVAAVVAAEERERCATICLRSMSRDLDGADIYFNDGYNAACEELAASIRGPNEKLSGRVPK